MRGQCAILRRSRTSEPTLTAERWFLSVCYPKADMLERSARFTDEDLEAAGLPVG